MGRQAARSVRIDQDATEAIITLGDHSPVIVTRASGPVFALTPLTERPPMPERAGPALLVAARHEVVPYMGRAEDRQEVAAWLTTDWARAVRLVTAPGGQGKTRFAIQVARDAVAAGWQVLIARHELDGGLLPVDSVPVPVTVEPAGVLVVVDYADRWARADLFELLKRPEASDGKLRVLLLARSDAFWSTLARTLGNAGVGVSVRALPALAEDGTARTAMFDAAVKAFGTEAVASGPVDPATVKRPDLSAEGFEGALAVQVAALVAVLRARERTDGMPPGAAGEALADPAAVTRELLVREVDHWQKLRERTPDPVRVSTRVMARAVVVATLSRGLPASDAVDLLGRLNVGADPQTVIDEHSQCYPATSRSRVLEPLYPDRLGEDFVAAVLPGAPPGPPDGLPLEFLADPAATATVDVLLQSDSSASTRTSALTILVETARRWDHVAATLLTRLREAPELLIGCGGTVIARAATIPALAPILPQVGKLLDDTIGRGSHLTLDPGAVVVQQQLVTQARSGDDRARLADSLSNLAIRLAAVGRRPEALDAAQEAADLCYELVGLNRDAHLPNLARSVNNLGNRLAAVGRRAEARDTTEEAVTLHRELVGVNRDAHLPDLAMSVSNLGIRLAEAGRRAEALDTALEAVTLYRELTKLNRDAYLPDLAVSVNNLGNHLAAVGRRAEALDAAQEAVTMRRELVRLNHDAHLPDLAMSVNNLGLRLAAVGRRAEALDTAQEAVTMRRELAKLNHDAYLPDLAMSVNNLGIRLAEAGRRAEALDTAQEAVTLYRELVGLNRDAYLPELAMSVNNLAIRLAEAGRRAEALDTTEEAVILYRELAKLNHDAHLPNLAMSVNNLAIRLAAVGRRAEALDAAQEAVTLYRELAKLNHDAHLPELAMSVNNLSLRLAEAGRRAEALDAAQESVTLRRELVRLNRDAHLSDLAVSVNNLSNHLGAVGRRAEALEAAQEAVTLRRELAKLNHDAYLPNLAMSVNNFGIRLAAVGRRAEALEAAQEAANYYSELDDRYPGIFDRSRRENQGVIEFLANQDTTS